MDTLPEQRRRRSLGTITYRATRDRFEIRLRERPGGRQISTYVAGPDTPERRLAAEHELAERISKLSHGVRHVERRETVGRWLDVWLELDGSIRPATRAAYEQRIRLYLRPTIGSVRLAELGPEHVALAMRQLERMPGARAPRLSVATIAGIHRCLAAALEDAWRLGKIPMNPCRIARVRRPSTRIEPPTPAELDRLFAELELRQDPPQRPAGGGRHPEPGGAWYAAFLALRWTGARRGEILGLEWRNVDLDAGILRLSRAVGGGELKTHASARPVPIPRFVADEIAALPRHLRSPYVFTTSSGAPLDPRNLDRRFDAALERSGIAPSEHADLDKYRVHDLRHSFATLLLEGGIAPHSVQAWLGHSSLAMLDRYAHVRAVPGGDLARRLVESFGPEILAHRTLVGGPILDPQLDPQAQRPRA